MFFRRIACLATLLWFLCFLVNAQGTSNSGTDFWVAYSGHNDGGTGANSSVLTLFITSQQNAVVNIDAGGSIMPTVNVAANQAVPVVINPNVQTHTYVGTSDFIEVNKGIHITSDVPIVVYSHISHSARSAATLVLPTKALGNEYYAISYDQSVPSSTKLSEFTLVGIENNTTVEITPTVASNTSLAKPPNIPFSITLNKGDVYQYQSATDVTNSRIKTLGDCKPIAVFSGSSFTCFCEPGNSKNASSGDNLYQQLFPVSSWGKNFATAPFYNAQNGSSDIIRIQISVNNTTVKVNGTSTIYQKGDIVTFASKVPNRIVADQPISVIQFQITQACSVGTVGDPEMTILSPIEQTLKDITLYSAISTPQAPTAITKHYLNIIFKTVDLSSLRVDGSIPAGVFNTIDNEYSYVTVDVSISSSINPTHRITCDNGFSAIAYGYGGYESYAYLAGADLKNLNANVQIYKPGSISSTDELCLNENYEIDLQLPYQTAKIVWELKKGATVIKTEILNPIAADRTEIVNGQTAYFYKYNNLLATDISVTGVYALKATVTNPIPTSCNADEEIAVNFTVFDLPVANFTSEAKACIENGINLSDASNPKGGTIKKWYWNFGDGTTETRTSSIPFQHNYSTFGDYTISLSVETESGCVSSTPFSKAVHIYEPPVADFTFNAPQCLGKEVLFTDKSSTTEGIITQWAWSFGDGSTSTLQNPTHTFTSSGTFAVSLYLLTDLGCSTLPTIKNITINPLPVADFDMPGICLQDASATFTNTSTASNGANLTYAWNFGHPASGAANTSTLRNSTHTYTSSGNYLVSLMVKADNDNCETNVTKTFTVNGSEPIANFFARNENILCSDQPVRFVDNATVDFGQITKIEWSFDSINFPNDIAYQLIDTSPALRAATPRTYEFQYPVFYSPASKTVDVRMRVYSGGTCYNDFIKTITLKAVPEVIFNPISDVCIDAGSIQLTQAEEIHKILTGTGKFSGNGVTINGIFDPAIAGVGNHSITFTFDADNGCTDSKTMDIMVNPLSAVNMGSSLVILQGGEIKLPATATGSNLTFKWTPSTALDQDDILNPIANPTDDITYSLMVTTDKGCASGGQIFIKVLKAPEVPNTFTPNGDGINDTWNIKYLESYPNAVIDIFNRYGEKVYSVTNYSSPWNGQKSGIDLPAATYYYIINPKNGRKIISGSVTIIR